MIMRRNFREWQRPLALGFKVGGRYRAAKGKNLGYIDAGSGLWIPGRDQVTQELDWFPNIVTNNGLDLLGSEQFRYAAQYFSTGAGNAAESVNDTALGSHLATVSTGTLGTTVCESSAPYYSANIRTERMDPGVGTGTVAELMVGSDNANSNAFSRVRVKDGGGSPTTIEKASDEWLDITYEGRLYPDHINDNGSTNDGTGTVTYDGNDYNYTIRPANITNNNYWSALQMGYAFITYFNEYGTLYGPDGALGAVTAGPSATLTDALSNGNITTSYSTYTPGTYTRDATLSIPLTEPSFETGIGAVMVLTGFGTYQVVFDTPIPKDHTELMDFPIRLSWTRKTIP